MGGGTVQKILQYNPITAIPMAAADVFSGKSSVSDAASGVVSDAAKGPGVGMMQESAAAKAAGVMDEISAANAKAIADAKAAEATSAAQAQAAITNKKRAIARSRTTYTSPLGLTTQAETARKTLLGM